MTLTEYWRRYFKHYYRKYRKNNRERIREITRKSDLKYKEKHDKDKKKYREKNREKLNVSFRELWKDNKEVIRAYKARCKIRAKNRLAKMSIHEKITNGLNKILKDIEFANLVGAKDLEYQEQIKLRLDTCKILVERWKEENEIPKEIHKEG